MKYLFTIISFLFSFSIKAQTANIKSVEQKGQKIYITYDLKGNPGSYNIKLFVKSNNSYSWSSALKSVSGNVGANQAVGINKQIIWDVLKDRDKFEGDWIFGIEAINVTEQKRLEESKARKKRKESKLARKQWGLEPKNQIGFITNFTAHPGGGLNYFNFDKFKAVGFYIDIRATDSFLYRGNHSVVTGGTGRSSATPCNAMLWTSVYNAGISFPIIRSSTKVIIFYFGLGQARTKLYDCYEPSTVNYTWYYYNYEKLKNLNTNFGFLIQGDSKFFYQIGHDSSIRKLYNTPGINIGIGLKI